MNKKLSILLLEDEILIREPVAEFLEDCGHDVFSSACPDESLHTFRERQFDVAIVDNSFPDHDTTGEHFILQAGKLSEQTKFIVHTANKEFSISQSLSQLGVTEKCVLIKPVANLNHILNTINICC